MSVTASRWTRPLALGVAGLSLTLVGAALVGPASAGPPSRGELTSKALRKAVTFRGINQHLEAFQEIASANGNTRASGTQGYRLSKDYVVERLRAAGYHPTVQTFAFPFYRELSPPTLEQTAPDPTAYTTPDDFDSMTYSAPGDVTAEVVPVDTDVQPTDTSTSGCEAADFAGFPAGAVALMQRGTCTFGAKIANAADAGAAAGIVFNRGTAGAEGAFAGTLGAPGEIPALGASFALAQDLSAPAGTRVHLVVDSESEIRDTWNVFAETDGGNAGNVVMAGAHLDSVVPGPGVNDNGSGSATVLEIAEQVARSKVRNKLRFAWWGAEELGLLGSEHYVADLLEANPAALEDIALYLNFDMVGSPNYVRFVYDGDNSAFPVGPGAAPGPPGSGDIERVFTEYFSRIARLPSAETPFSGRSDYGPFIAAGVDIPAGGLFTGAEGVKTEEEAELFGGEAGVAYDVCYHQACDTIDNVNPDAVDEMSDAVAHAVATYARSTASLAEDDGARPSGRSSARELARTGLHPHHDEVAAR